MFTSKGLFSKVACPYQSTCMLPKCLFSHSENHAQDVPKVVMSDEIDIGEEDRPAKRQKLGGGGPIPNDAGPLASKTKAKAPSLEKNRPSQSSRAETPQTIISGDRSISPPPLKRKSQLPTRHSPRNGNTITSEPAVGTSISTPAPLVKSVPAKVPLKEEVLHPRSLKGPAPATFAIRYKLIQLLHEQFTRLNSELKSDANDEEEKLLLSDQGLIRKTLDLEEDASATPSIYSNIVKAKIGVYKKMTVPQWKDERAREIAVLTAAKALKPAADPEAPPKVVETGLAAEEEIQILPRLLSSLAGLDSHGYVITVPTDSEIESARAGIEAAQGWEQCDRCKSRFQVFPGRREEDGVLASGGVCTYHYGRARFPERSAFNPNSKREKRFGCCNQPLGDSPGCTTAPCHVFKISEVKRMASVLNFEKTPDNPERNALQPVCIDGEMGYTVYGLELIRLTATSWPGGEGLFDVLVRPVGEVMDLNSRFSGIWPQDYAEATVWEPELSPPQATTSPEVQKSLALAERKLRMVPSPAAARSLLFSFLSPETPLIGHGLENDMNATRIIHPTIIDTALLFPHPQGLPYRNGLKALMLRHLNRHVQVVVDGKMLGHDSMEDAKSAGELVRFSLASKWSVMKREGWTFEKGLLKPPRQSASLEAPSGPEESKKRTFGEVEVEDGELDGLTYF